MWATFVYYVPSVMKRSNLIKDKIYYFEAGNSLLRPVV